MAPLDEKTAAKLKEMEAKLKEKEAAVKKLRERVRRDDSILTMVVIGG